MTPMIQSSTHPIIYAFCALLAYLLGAVPFGFIVAKAHGIDIRTKGSGNIGATNVFRTIGRGWGIFTFALDVGKGFAAAFVIPYAVMKTGCAMNRELLGIITACSAVAGHNWPVYLKFKGGKGIATTAGALLGIAPAALGTGLLAWLIVFPISRYVSLASIIAAATVPAAGWLLYRDAGMLVPSFLTVLAIVAIIRHKANIKRLLKGTENRFDFKRKTGDSK